MNYRIEKDTLGEIQVPEDCYWGDQTARSLKFFDIGIEKMPREIINALCIVKKACAAVNADLGLLAPEKAEAILRAAVGGGADGVSMHMRYLGEDLVRAMKMTGCESLDRISPDILW